MAGIMSKALSNVDRPTAAVGDYQAAQPDSGVATSGLPASNTSVGRFVRAAFYAQYTEKAETPQRAVTILAHEMNNFDRPLVLPFQRVSSEAAEGTAALLASGGD